MMMRSQLPTIALLGLVLLAALAGAVPAQQSPDEAPLPKDAAAAQAELDAVRKRQAALRADDVPAKRREALEPVLTLQADHLQGLVGVFQSREGLAADEAGLAKRIDGHGAAKRGWEARLEAAATVPEKVTAADVLKAAEAVKDADRRRQQADQDAAAWQSELERFPVDLADAQGRLAEATAALKEAREKRRSGDVPDADPDAVAALREAVRAAALREARLAANVSLLTAKQQRSILARRLEEATLRRDAVDAELTVLRRRHKALEERHHELAVAEIEAIESRRPELEALIEVAEDFERPFLRLKLEELEIIRDTKNAEAEMAEWSSRCGTVSEVGVAGVDSQSLAEEIRRAEDDPDALHLPERADDLRVLVAAARARGALADRVLKELRAKMVDARRSALAASRAKEGVAERIAAAEDEFRSLAGGRRTLRVNDARWKDLRRELATAHSAKVTRLTELGVALRTYRNAVEDTAVRSRENLLYLKQRLRWTREESDISWAAVQQAAETAVDRVDNIGQLPGRAWHYLTGFVTDASNRLSVIIGGVVIVILLILIFGVHRRMPQRDSWYQRQAEGHGMLLRVLAIVLRRTELTFATAAIFVGVPLALGMAPGFIGFLAVIFGTPFVYRLGRVLLDLLFAPDTPDDRLSGIDNDDLARLLHKAGRYLLNLALFFVPVGLLMGLAGYGDDNAGFVELWWLVYKVLSHVVLLLTVFRPVVVRHLIRGEGVVAVSVKTWIFILYPVVVGAVLFLFVLGSLRYLEAESFFRALFLKTAGVLLGGYVLYRVALRGVMKGKDLDRRLTPDDFEGTEAYHDAGRVLFFDRLIRLGFRLGFLVPGVFLLMRFWSEVDMGFVDHRITDGGLTPRDLGIAMLAILVTLVVVRILRQLLAFVTLPKTSLDRGVQYTVVTLSSYAVWGLAIIVALNILNVRGEQIAFVMSALMLGIGFGLQSIVKNFVSGLILLIERPVKVGDRVEVGAKSGAVDKITLRATTVMTWDGVGIVIPNEQMIGSTLTNHSLGRPRLRTTLNVGVGYDSDIQAVRKTLAEVVKGHGLVLKRPEPEVFFVGFGDSSLDFQVRYWTSMSVHRLRVVSDLRFAITAAFRRDGVEIPFPQRDINLRTPVTIGEPGPAGEGGGDGGEGADVVVRDVTEAEAPPADAERKTPTRSRT